MSPRCLLLALALAGSAHAMPPFATDDASTLGPDGAKLELTQTPAELGMALHAAPAEHLQAGASFQAGDPRQPALDLKWRLLAASERSGVALRLGQSAAQRDALLVASAELGELGADLNAGVLGDRGYSSLLLSLPTPGSSLLAVELTLERAPGGVSLVAAKAGVVAPLSDVAALSFDLSPRHVLGGEASLAATVGVSVGVDFALGAESSELTTPTR